MYGWPHLVHYCDLCDHNTAVEYSPSVWTEAHKCNSCGVWERGVVDITGRGEAAMNVSQQDELAHLFAQRMNLAPQHQHQQQQQQPVVQPFNEKIDIVQQPVHYASSHYTQSAHVRPNFDATTPPPPYSQLASMPDETFEMLRRNGVDPVALLPAQVHLFQHAQHEQRVRLLELWRIAPPSYPRERHLDIGTWHPTTVEQEEFEARQRYEQMTQERQQSQVRFDSLAHTQTAARALQMPIAPIREHGESAWPPAARMRAASIASSQPASRPLTHHEAAEPYILNGYEQDMQRPVPQVALDPVYTNAVGTWQAPYPQALDQMAMENQYGAFDQIRNHADWERMNEMTAKERFAGVQSPAILDYEDMML